MSEKENGKLYYRSLEDLADDPAVRKFEDEEFPDLASEKSGPLPRRSFLKIMGASAALAGGISGCRFPVEKIVPYSGRPVNTEPGNPLHFTTAFEMGGFTQGLLVKSFDGRPVKIEGNPKHPLNKGASNAWAQASLLDLYDPDRSKYPVQRINGKETPRTWDEFKAYIGPIMSKHKANKGKGLYFLSEMSLSPTFLSLRKRILSELLPHAQWAGYEPLSMENMLHGRIMSCFGEGIPYHDLSQANIILSLDSDFLYSHPLSNKYVGEFTGGRTAHGGKMKRLYVVESSLSVTGAAADERIPLKPTEIVDFAKLLLVRTARNKKPKLRSYVNPGVLDTPYIENLAREIATHADRYKRYEKSVSAIIDDFRANWKKSVILCGFRQSPDLHGIVQILNLTYGQGADYAAPNSERARSGNHNFEMLNELARTIDLGKVETILILGGNPVYNAPADIGLGYLLKKVNNSIHLGVYSNETSKECSWHITQAHYLESWGDVSDYTGTYSVIQPLIAPLYNGKSTIEILSLIADPVPQSGYDLVKNEFIKNFIPGIQRNEKDWEKILNDGYTRRPNEPLPLGGNCLAGWTPQTEGPGGLEINFVPDNSVYDGRFANNAWLQEMPDPITKLTWGNAALMSPATAKEHNIKRGDVIKLNYKGRSLEIPALILPGHADGAVTVPLGYGRIKCGGVGDGVGANGYLLRTSDAPWYGAGLTIEKTGKRVELATTQEHQKIKAVGEKEKERRRPLHVREADLDHYREHPDFARHMVHHPPLESLWTEHEYKGHRWGMAIDLSRCTGCNTCLVACQAENNIPVVGREQVLLGREMHWIRVDRWFSGDPENPKVSFQPVPCQQCENAPCESVCPVGATVHSSEGLNDMVYNRCIGMRFCSNNCPYKVRRFNYFLNHKGVNDIQKMVFNPDVTVRARGVMEKCTYCVQRIQEAKIKAKNERRKIVDGEIVPACAQACPAGAIVFGDLNDPAARVRKLHGDPRAYALLEEYNFKPRTVYLAKIRNPAPGMDDNDGEDEGA